MNQQEMKEEYKHQQTHEGREAVRVRRELAAKLSMILGRPMKTGVINALIDGNTGKTTRYFIAE